MLPAFCPGAYVEYPAPVPHSFFHLITTTSLVILLWLIYYAWHSKRNDIRQEGDEWNVQQLCCRMI